MFCLVLTGAPTVPGSSEAGPCLSELTLKTTRSCASCMRSALHHVFAGPAKADEIVLFALDPRPMPMWLQLLLSRIGLDIGVLVSSNLYRRRIRHKSIAGKPDKLYEMYKGSGFL